MIARQHSVLHVARSDGGVFSFLLSVVLLSVALAGCPQPARPEPPDDATVERDTGRTDAPSCEPGCSSTRERCCSGVGGPPRCVNVWADPSNCGLCGLDCVATQRGDGCDAMQCTCGGNVGCTGDLASVCCPATSDTPAHCANLGRDFADCGACGRACDPTRANRCEGGTCRCGLDGRICDGTPASRCCVDRFDVASCVDLRTDRNHCGACDRLCRPFEACVDGECVASDSAG